MLALRWWMWANASDLLLGIWLITPRSDTMLWTSWAPAAGRLVLSSGCRQVILGEWKSTLLCSCITAIPVTMTILLMTPLNNGRSGREKRLTGIHRIDCLVHLSINNILLCWSHTLASTDICFAHLERFTYIPLPQTTLLPNFPSYFLQIPDYPANHWLQHINRYRYINLPSFLLLSKISNQLHCLILPTQRTVLHHCPSGMTQKACSATLPELLLPQGNLSFAIKFLQLINEFHLYYPVYYPSPSQLVVGVNHIYKVLSEK